MRRVLDLAVTQLRDWEDQGVTLSLAVNLSARQLSDLTLPGTVPRRSPTRTCRPSACCSR
jgi:EAL domain-containing protein (putative c-di-GMP-specific phosphodiesterase class I)